MHPREQRRSLRVARDLVVRAGEMLRRRQPGTWSVGWKRGTGNMVSGADRASERMIVGGIRKAFPDHDIIAEEETRRETGSPCRWYIDPLDGTMNYLYGIPVYAISVALEVEGRLEAGVVGAPALGEIYDARRGGGARRNGRKIRVSRTRSMAGSLLATGFSYRRPQMKRNLAYFGRFLAVCRAMRRLGSAALDLCWTACGSFDGFWEFDLGSWDIAAGALIVEEAGGRVTDFRGGPMNLMKGEILASNGPIHGAMMKQLRRKV